MDEFNAGVTPELARRGKSRLIEFDTDGTLDPLRSEYGQGGRIETPSADSWLAESDRFQRRIGNGVDKPSNFQSQSIRRCKLAEPISLGLRSLRIQCRLDCLTTRFNGLFAEANHFRLESQLQQIRDAMFPHPVYALGCFVAEIIGTEIPA